MDDKEVREAWERYLRATRHLRGDDYERAEPFHFARVEQSIFNSSSTDNPKRAVTKHGAQVKK